MVDLGKYHKGIFTHANGIKDDGEVIGCASLANGETHAAVCMLKDRHDHDGHHYN